MMNEQFRRMIVDIGVTQPHDNGFVVIQSPGRVEYNYCDRGSTALVFMEKVAHAALRFHVDEILIAAPGDAFNFCRAVLRQWIESKPIKRLP